MLSLIFVLINARSSTETLGGWAIPAATDIACVLAVLAVVGSRLPAAVRTILLTPAVVDDLIAIIAVFYTSSLQLHYLLPLLVPIVAYAFVVRRCDLLLNTGIHATIAGVVWAFMVSASVPERARAMGAHHGLADTLEHHLRPVSAAPTSTRPSRGAMR